MEEADAADELAAGPPLEAARSSRRPAPFVIPMPHHVQEVPRRGVSDEGKAAAADPGATTVGAEFAKADAALFEAASHLADEAFVDAAAADLGLTALRAVRVRHCNKAYGLRLEFASAAAVSAAPGGAPQAWSLVYSGDTRPCPELVALGRGGRRIAQLAQLLQLAPPPLLSWWRGPAELDAAADAARSGCGLLIHEATFEDDEEGRANALAKRHSTAGEACDVAAGIGARHTLLTHFSARYPKLPVVSGGADGVEVGGGTLFVAYDLMRVTGATLAQLPALLPALHVLFAEEEEDANAIA